MLVARQDDYDEDSKNVIGNQSNLYIYIYIYIADRPTLVRLCVGVL